MLMLGAVVLTFVFQLIVIYWKPANDIFNTQPLTLRELLICIGASSIVFFAVEIEKAIKRKVQNRTEPISITD